MPLFCAFHGGWPVGAEHLKLEPYASNTVPPTLNKDDVFFAPQAAEENDPFVVCVWLQDMWRRWGARGGISWGWI